MAAFAGPSLVGYLAFGWCVFRLQYGGSSIYFALAVASKAFMFLPLKTCQATSVWNKKGVKLRWRCASALQH
jgi:hypothetical protein